MAPRKPPVDDDGFDLDDLNKLPMRSKKFLAYLISEASWKIVLFSILALYRDKIDYYAFFLLLAIIVTNGFLQIGYILGQVALDKYSAVAREAVASNRGTPRATSTPRAKRTPPEEQIKVIIDEDD